MTTLRRLGYWLANDRPNLPDPHRFIDESWSERDRHSVGTYFSAGTIARAYLGQSTCRICGVSNGSAEYSDGIYLWPEGLAHYILEHAVRLPAVAEAYAIRRLTELEDADVDEDWWTSAAR